MNYLTDRIQTLKERYKETGDVKWHHRAREVRTTQENLAKLREKLWEEYDSGLDSPPD